MATMRFTILGCGSSGGVPRLGGHWGACDPQNPKNRRKRCSLLVQRLTETGTTTVLIDTTPDMRQQLLDAEIGVLDGVIFTHSHADHVHGLDDLRQIVFNTKERLRVWADDFTKDSLFSRFAYAFEQPAGSPYPPILDMHLIDGPVTVDGPGGEITFTPFLVNHGAIDALGFRIGDLAYLPDVAEMYDDAWAHLNDLDMLILDALRHAPHPTHIHLDKALDWIERLQPKQAILTNMHIDMDYADVLAKTPDHVTPAHDGLTIETSD